MSFLDDLLRGAQGVVAQVNPFDGGADFQSVTRPQAIAPPQQPQTNTGYQNTIPIGQSLTSQNIQALPQNIQPLAQIYSQNPQDPRVSHLDPAMFGYRADNTVLRPFRSRILGSQNPSRGIYSPGEGLNIPQL